MTVAVVLGGADCLEADVAAYRGPVDAVIGVNDAGYWYGPGLDVWVSLHPEKFVQWDEKRVMAGIPEPGMMVSHRQPKPNICVELDLVSHYLFDGMRKSGSSGLFATKIALDDLGFDHVVLCGVPMQPDNDHFHMKGPWRPAEDFRKSWLDIPDEYMQRIRSMSGWTRVLCGLPAWNDAKDYSDITGKATKGDQLWQPKNGN